jgi:ketosteroid isomerase-like protein
MGITRRQLAFTGALALGAVGLLPSRGLLAQSSDEASVSAAVEALTKAMLDADRARLDDLTSDQLSYGHSSGRFETKAQFIDVVAGKKTIYKSIALSEPTVAVAGNNAIVRHVFSGETESDGKPGSARVGVLQVWQKQQDGRWKLLARQAFKL